MSPLQPVHKHAQPRSDDFIEGYEFLKDRSMPKAVRSFRLAYESVDRSDVYHNKYASYSGLSRVLSGDSSGITLCREAVRGEIHDGDVFLNLARAECYLNNRKRTIVALKKGLHVDNRHPGLRLMREKLGIRQRSTLPFLPRTHPLNHALGKLLRSDKDLI